VIVLDDGVVRFYDDLYGQDAALDRALGDDYSHEQSTLRSATPETDEPGKYDPRISGLLHSR
jgi:hypothetical protein